MSRTYHSRKARTERIVQGFVHRDLWPRNALRTVGGELQDWRGNPIQCCALVEEIRESSRGARRVKVRCVKNATRRSPGHGAPVCSGGCRAPEYTRATVHVPGVSCRIIDCERCRESARLAVKDATLFERMLGRVSKATFDHLVETTLAIEACRLFGIKPLDPGWQERVLARIDAENHDPGDEDRS